MKKLASFLTILLFLLGGVLFTQVKVLLNNDNVSGDVIISNTTNINSIKIANWNLQIFGDSKSSESEIMDFYVKTIDNYDIIFIQEIRDSTGSSFEELCSMLIDYDCEISSRAGRTNNKEQYGVIYKKGITANLKDFNPDSKDRWERPPIEVSFESDNYKFKVYNIHTKPEDVESELNFLEEIVPSKGNVIILGDLNADCNYYNPSDKGFDDWYWVIDDDEDTTSSSTNCAYDRIILNSDSYKEYISKGIFKKGITKDISDHYLVWVELKKG